MATFYITCENYSIHFADKGPSFLYASLDQTKTDHKIFIQKILKIENNTKENIAFGAKWSTSMSNGEFKMILPCFKGVWKVGLNNFDGTIYDFKDKKNDIEKITIRVRSGKKWESFYNGNNYAGHAFYANNISVEPVL